MNFWVFWVDVVVVVVDGLDGGGGVEVVVKVALPPVSIFHY